jgi:Uma2 family endonuclease
MMNATSIFADYETDRHKAMPSINHGSIQANLLFELAAYRKKFRICSEVSLDLSDWESVPDICIFPSMPIDTRNDVVTVLTAPLCAVEIISPSQSLNELLTKAGKYFDGGVQSCWLVLPGLDNIYVFSKKNNYQMFRFDQTLRDELLGIEFPLSDVFK